MGNEKKKFVVGVLCKDGKCLAEKRHTNEEHFGGMTIFPGGLIEVGETAEVALVREMKEELDIKVKKYNHLMDFVYEKDGCPLTVFTVTEWEGEPKAQEAESILWARSEEELSDELNKEIYRCLQKQI